MNYITIKEYAKKYKVSKEKVYWLIKNKKINWTMKRLRILKLVKAVEDKPVKSK